MQDNYRERDLCSLLALDHYLLGRAAQQREFHLSGYNGEGGPNEDGSFWMPWFWEQSGPNPVQKESGTRT